MLNDTAVHILGGGIGGTFGAVVTCPLEVVKVRLQSSQGLALHSGSVPTFQGRRFFHFFDRIAKCPSRRAEFYTASDSDKIKRTPLTAVVHPNRDNQFVVQKNVGLRRSVVIRCLMDISHNEGFRALFKGFFPTIIGVLPSRGIYFSAYHKGQVFFEDHFPAGSSGVFFCAAGFGSIVASSLTNPIWFVKTRLQLDSRPGHPPITVGHVIRNTWKQDGWRGFYRGVTASYLGSLETAVNFVIYENVKARLLWWDRQRRQQQIHRFAVSSASCNAGDVNVVVPSQSSGSMELRGSLGGSKLNASSDMVLCMIASAFSKAVAITATYPHEVIRTRLREAHGRYRGLINTFKAVVREEGAAGLYRGMGTHYIRQVPNSCIMIGTYEVVVFLLQSWGLTRLP